MKRFILIAGWFVLLLPLQLHADTYNERTLVRIALATATDREFIQSSSIDVVDAGPDWVKALLRPSEFLLLADRGLKVEILWDEMERDRALWRAADEAAKAHVPNASYYTPSHFDTVNPPPGSLMEHLLALHNANPNITRLYDIGDVVSGNYDIIAIEVSKNPDVDENEPKIRIYGNIHGDEKSALMVPCDVLDWILNNYPSDPAAAMLVDHAELWFIPMGNPDGNAANSRYNGHGIDLNRNFWGPNGNEDPPGDPFSEPETQAIRDLTEVMGKRFTASISFHAGAIVFNSVYNYTSTATTDEPIFFSSRTGGPNGGAMPSPFGLAQAYENGCTTQGFWYTNGADWYITRGDTNDWSYAKWSDLDTTLEVTLDKTPPVSQIPIFCAEHRQAVI
ncbi:MAG TPA: M14 family zinc carboxypeptidase, partial [Acidobacteriota bacterium]|nr:M14 family zinc carboxypeptidase [Acidobacteriota bacterium]